MKMLLDEERIVIPHYDEMWNIIKNVIKQKITTVKPSMVNNFRRWSLPMNIKGSENAFYNNLTLVLDLYVINNENLYSQINDDFADSEINPKMILSNNGKIDTITIRIRVATSQKHMEKDIGTEFYHELTHAYEYWGRLKNGKQFHELQAHATYDVSSLRRILNSQASPLEKNLAVLFYFIDEDEYNARLNGFYNEIKHNPPKSNNIKQVIEQTKEWRKIAFLYNVPFYMNKVTNPEDQKKLIIVGNIMNEKTKKNKYSNYQSLLNDVIAKYNKLKNNAYKDFSEIIQDINNKKR